MTIPMPEPVCRLPVSRDETDDLYSAEQMQDYATAKVREALEAAEEAVTTLYESDDEPYLPDIANAIRALISEHTSEQ